jgi:hypothetical protein
VPLADFTAIDALWIVLSVFLAVVGLALAYLLVRLAAAAGRLTRLLRGLEDGLVPLVHKTGGTVDRVNLQLDKVDLVTDSAVSAADSADTAVRAVSLAVTRPVQKLSAVAKGISHGASALVATHDVRAAMDAGRDAASRREQELAEELARSDRLARLHQQHGTRPAQSVGAPPAATGESSAGVGETPPGAGEQPVP